MKTKILTTITTFALILSSANAFSQEMKKEEVKPTAKSEKSHKQHKSEHKKMHSEHHNSEKWKSVLADTLGSVKTLVSMGAKVIKDGNSSSEPEKMMMGAKMMLNGIEVLAGYKEHHLKHSKKSMNSADMTKENKDTIHKEVHESAELLIMMANKLIKEGNTNNEGQKMMIGSEMLKTGTELHHSYMSVEHSEMVKGHKMIIKAEEIIIKK